MPGNLPLEIQTEIMRRLPVKSLIRFRSVSKAWKSLIDSTHFIAHYNGQMQHLLVRYNVGSVGFQKHVSIVDDHTFPQQRVSLTLPLLVNMFKFHRIIGSSHGLLCLYGYYRRGCNFSVPGKHMVVLWNISIRKAVAVVEPDVEDGIRTTIIGFGVCRETTDPKIVKIKHVYAWNHMESIPCVPWQVEVFTLSTGAWRSPNNNPPRKSIEFIGSQVVVDGFLYWLATDTVTIDGGFRSYNLIILFDMTSEEFIEINLPDSLAHHSVWNLSISKLRESLVVVKQRVEADNLVFGVWMMEGSVPNSFTMLFNLNVNAPDASVRGFRKTGEPIIELVEDLGIYKLVVYEPHSKHINILGFDGTKISFNVYSYMETLLLVDQPDLTIYNKGKRCILKHTS
ncbi:putative F-box domain-containing protein [Helianthus annuus]|uniref:F-box domain-containing protein n=1 Tax=Helianthus annuus TaxID=4232 RepID=A0A251UKM1_HELAN|nr:putative F-box domain-containing protein [Helianthus annuus]KAJ0561736.1 putative F-box domain-containing protein [Helianthus annuus]KAJ0574800.1 putative F-box domain-containing protein [Helianthus annuus]KAJ0739131.1 putative F-box domain-containing protein [Helianthus annuus]KAJ0741987.1 putative F-box domain-containing protein [Helianthus annuus]